uniref:Protein shisa-5 n=1 Tax=Cyprinus carpio TaxID=7962 RepID=A0A8C1RVC1_CYPCA
SSTMASTSVVLLLLSAGLFMVTVGDDCKSYYTSNNEYRSSMTCLFGTHCCGTCDNRFCCPFRLLKLSKQRQNFCNINIGIVIGLSVAGVVVLIISVVVTCCCCPWCSVVQTHVNYSLNPQSIQMQPEVQYTQYQPVPTQPSYGGQPMQTGPYQEQSNAPGPPPSYDMATSPGYPTIQGTSNQPAYSPAYMQPPNTSY